MQTSEERKSISTNCTFNTQLECKLHSKQKIKMEKKGPSQKDERQRCKKAATDQIDKNELRGNRNGH